MAGAYCWAWQVVVAEAAEAVGVGREVLPCATARETAAARTRVVKCIVD